jgi:hypothetical protein
VSPAEAAEIAAIRDNLAAYNHAGDRGKLEELAATFAEDGILETEAWKAEGRAAIATTLRQQTTGRERPGLTFVRHHLTTCRIALTGADTATARTYFFVMTDIGPDHAGVYKDRLTKKGGEWRFARREVRLDWVAPHSVFAPPSATRARQGRQK